MPNSTTGAELFRIVRERNNGLAAKVRWGGLSACGKQIDTNTRLAEVVQNYELTLVVNVGFSWIKAELGRSDENGRSSEQFERFAAIQLQIGLVPRLLPRFMVVDLK